MRECQLWLGLDGPSVTADGLVQAPLRLVQLSELDMGWGKKGKVGGDVLKHLDGLVHFPRSPEHLGGLGLRAKNQW